MHRTLLNKQLVRALVCGWRPDTLTLRHVKLLWLVTACWVHEPAQRLPFAQIVVLLDKKGNSGGGGGGGGNGGGGGGSLPLGAGAGDGASGEAARAAIEFRRNFSPFNLIDRITMPPMAPNSAYSPLPVASRSASGSHSPMRSELSSDSLIREALEATSGD